MIIVNIHHNTFGEIIGECQGRKVKWTWSVSMWYFNDTGEYIYNPIVK